MLEAQLAILADIAQLLLQRAHLGGGALRPRRQSSLEDRELFQQLACLAQTHGAVPDVVLKLHLGEREKSRAIPCDHRMLACAQLCHTGLDASLVGARGGHVDGITTTFGKKPTCLGELAFYLALLGVEDRASAHVVTDLVVGVSGGVHG